MEGELRRTRLLRWTLVPLAERAARRALSDRGGGVFGLAGGLPGREVRAEVRTSRNLLKTGPSLPSSFAAV